MKISNLRVEERGNEATAYLVADVECSFSKSKELWFSVDKQYKDWLTDDVYDAFLVAAIWPAMFYNENVEIKGKVSAKLLYNVKNYIPSIVQIYRDRMNDLNVTVDGFALPLQTKHLCGTGFSAGVDSFATFYDRYEKEENPEFKIGALFMFNVGSHGGGGEHARKMFHQRYDLLKSFPEYKGLPYVAMDSNLFDFYQDRWEYDAGAFCRACAILVFQKVISRYYLSSDSAYIEQMHNLVNYNTASIAGITELYLNPLLSTESLDIITDGAQYSRTQKTELIADYKPAQQYLNVCVNHWGDRESATNCGFCSKCLRTLICLEALGKLSDFSRVFDIQAYRQISYKYKCELVSKYNSTVYNKDNVDFAKSQGLKMPSKFEASIYLMIVRVKYNAKRLIRKILRHFWGG
jgi:hypothetical protein